MQAKVLVAYATRCGFTQKVAQIIADVLRESGFSVNFEPMRQVKTLEEYTAKVLGAPLYIFHWHKDAHKFLLQHHDALTKRQVAVFALGALSSDEEECKEVRAQLDKEIARYSFFTPVAIKTVGGKFDA